MDEELFIPDEREEGKGGWSGITWSERGEMEWKAGEEGDWIRLGVFVEFVEHVRWCPCSAGRGEYEVVAGDACGDDECFCS